MKQHNNVNSATAQVRNVVHELWHTLKANITGAPNLQGTESARKVSGICIIASSLALPLTILLYLGVKGLGLVLVIKMSVWSRVERFMTRLILLQRIVMSRRPSYQETAVVGWQQEENGGGGSDRDWPVQGRRSSIDVPTAVFVPFIDPLLAVGGYAVKACGVTDVRVSCKSSRHIGFIQLRRVSHGVVRGQQLTALASPAMGHWGTCPPSTFS